jgi:hypothetical protein
MRWCRSHLHTVFSAGRDSIVKLSHLVTEGYDVQHVLAETVISVGETDRVDIQCLLDVPIV